MECPRCGNPPAVEDYTLYDEGDSDYSLLECSCEDCRISFDVKYRIHLESPKVTYIESWDGDE